MGEGRFLSESSTRRYLVGVSQIFENHQNGKLRKKNSFYTFFFNIMSFKKWTRQNFKNPLRQY